MPLCVIYSVYTDAGARSSAARMSTPWTLSVPKVPKHTHARAQASTARLRAPRHNFIHATHFLTCILCCCLFLVYARTPAGRNPILGQTALGEGRTDLCNPLCQSFSHLLVAASAAGSPLGILDRIRALFAAPLSMSEVYDLSSDFLAGYATFFGRSRWRPRPPQHWSLQATKSGRAAVVGAGLPSR